jgi:hypothetical protein
MKTEWIWSLGASIGLVLGTVLAGCQHDDEQEGRSGACLVISDCNGGEQCEAGLCVPIVGGEDDDDGTSEDDGPADSGPADSGPAGTGPGGSGPADSGPADSGPSADCDEGEFSCEVDHIEACVDGGWEQYTCDEICATDGYTSSGCSSADQCGCDGFADEDCATGVGAFCACLASAGESCSDDEFVSFYQECRSGAAPELECFADYVSGNQVDCLAATEACL